MYVVIVGAGRIGFSLAAMLIEAGHEVTIVEQDHSRVREIGSLDAHVLHGTGTNPTTLESINVTTADAIVAVTGDDAVNLTSCLVARGMVSKNKRDRAFMTVARVSNTDMEKPFLDLGIDRVISPEKAAATYIARLIRSPGVIDVTAVGGLGEMLELRIDEGSPVIGKTLAEISAISDMSCSTVVAVIEDDELIIPHGDTTLKAGMRVFIFCKVEESKKARRQFLGRD